MQKTNYVAFDLEITKPIPGDFSQWENHRPLGITCASLTYDGYQPQLWYSMVWEGQYAPKMTRTDLQKLVSSMLEAVDTGWKIVTWNGLGFDFNVLAEESGMLEDCRLLALNHIDLMFHFFCQMGYPLALEKAARGLGLPGKLDGVSGEDAPFLWQMGSHQTVLNYVAQDTITVLEIAKLVQKRKFLPWISNQGKPQRANFPYGWLPVNQAFSLPWPETYWMTDPLQREEFITWIVDPTSDRTVTPKSGADHQVRVSYQLSQYSKDMYELYPEEEVELFEGPLTENNRSQPQKRSVGLRNMPEGCSCAVCRGVPNEDPIFRSRYTFIDDRRYDSRW